MRCDIWMYVTTTMYVIWLNEIITNDIQDGTTRCFIGWFTRGWGAGGREVTVGRSVGKKGS